MKNLMPHQIEGIEKIRKAFLTNRAFLNASEVGTGKTRQACEVAKDYSKVLIVAPISTFTGWQREAEAVGLETHTAGIMWPGGKCTIVNYERLEKYKQIGSWDAKKRMFEAKSFDLIVWDECHKIRNHKSKRFKIFQSLNLNCKHALFLSATPGQSPMDLAYLREVIGFNSFWPWVRSFEGIYKNKWGGFDFRRGHDFDTKRLKKIIEDNPFAIRRTPQDIAGWPELNRIILPIALTPAQAETYRSAMDDYIDARNEAGKKGLPFGTYDMVAVGQFRKALSFLKVDSTVEMSKNLVEQGKVVTISCEYVVPADDIKIQLQAAGLKVGLINGNTFQDARREILIASSKDELDVIIFTIQEGINLQQYEDGHRERIQLGHDVRWSSIAQHQIDGRTNRASRSAIVYWIICAGTVDERVAKVLKSRMETLNDIVGETNINPDNYLFGYPHTPASSTGEISPVMEGSLSV